MAGKSLVILINTVFQVNILSLLRRRPDLGIHSILLPISTTVKSYIVILLTAAFGFLKKTTVAMKQYNVSARISAKFRKSIGYNLITIVQILQCQKIIVY